MNQAIRDALKKLLADLDDFVYNVEDTSSYLRISGRELRRSITALTDALEAEDEE